MTDFVKMIFDIGMHIGQDTATYLKMGYRVVAVEANPLLVEANRKKFKSFIDKGQLTIVHAGITEREGEMPFYVNQHLTEWSSFDLALASRENTPYETVMVPCITTASLFRKYGMPWYLKIDIEGYDIYCLNDIQRNGEKPVYVSCEASELQLLDVLRDKGYTQFKIIDQTTFKPLNIKREKIPGYPFIAHMRNRITLRLQKFVPVRYTLGSSGPFAEFSDGEWMSYEQVKKMYQSFYNVNNEPLRNNTWFDFHAK